MNCSSCGANLPPGAVVCPVCGASTPYNAGSPVYQPNVPASSYGGPTPPPQGYDPNAPTYISSPYGTPASQQQVPPTSYGSQPYDSNPYGAASNPYAPTDPYSAPVAPQPPLYPGGFPPPVQPPQRRSRLGLIIGIIVLVLVLACAGLHLYLRHPHLLVRRSFLQRQPSWATPKWQAPSTLTTTQRH